MPHKCSKNNCPDDSIAPKDFEHSTVSYYAGTIFFQIEVMNFDPVVLMAQTEMHTGKHAHMLTCTLKKLVSNWHRHKKISHTLEAKVVSSV